MLSDIEIAQKAEMKPIVEIGEKVGIAPENLEITDRTKPNYP